MGLPLAQEGVNHITTILSVDGLICIPFRLRAKCMFPLVPNFDDTTLKVDQLPLINLEAIKNEMPKMSI